MAADITHILLLKQEWADRILSGEKSLEIRSTGTRKRGRIGIAVQNLLFGCVDLTGSMALTPEQLAAELPRHLCPLDEITAGRWRSRDFSQSLFRLNGIWGKWSGASMKVSGLLSLWRVAVLIRLWRR